MARYLTAEQKAFYLSLEASLEHFPGFTKLPDPTHWDRYKPMFHLLRAKHVIDPDGEDNWVCFVDYQAEYVTALPREICPEGLISYEEVASKVEKAKARLTRKAREAATEYGEFEVKRDQGRIFIRHIGAVPV